MVVAIDLPTNSHPVSNGGVFHSRNAEVQSRDLRSVRGSEPMKPNLSIALITLGLTFPAPALAEPIHLTCTETKATRGDDLLVWPIYINAATGTGTVSGDQQKLSVTPDQYRFHKVEYKPWFSLSTFEINRITLKFTWKLVQQLGEMSESESSGHCRITPVASGARI